MMLFKVTVLIKIITTCVYNHQIICQLLQLTRKYFHDITLIEVARKTFIVNEIHVIMNKTKEFIIRKTVTENKCDHKGRQK